MWDPQVPLDVRIDMAVAAAPFVHAKPQAPPRVRTNPMGSSPIKSSPDFTPFKMQEELRVPETVGADGLGRSGESGAGGNGAGGNGQAARGNGQAARAEWMAATTGSISIRCNFCCA